MKNRIISAFLLVFVAVIALIPAMGFSAEAAEKTVTLSFASKDQRTSFTTSQQIWEQNGIKLTNDKGSSTSNVADYAAPARFYKGSTITIEYPGMTKIVFACSGSSYAKAPTGLTGATASTSGSTLTITLNEPIDSFTFNCNGSQLRVNTITITAVEKACEHTNTTTTDTATCTADGTKTVTCNDCDEIISSEASAAKGHTPGAAADCENDQICTVCEETLAEALGHNYVDGSCTGCGQADPDACAHTNTTTIDTATCTAGGEKITTCDDCEAELSREASSAKGHTPGAAADCENDQICTVCSEVVTEALGHDYDENGTCHCGDQLPLATFVVPEGATAVDGIFGLSFTAPVAPTLPDVNYDYDYTFIGWAKAEQDGVTVKPTVYNAGSDITITEDTTFYAVYSYVEATLVPVVGYIKTELADIKSTDKVVIVFTTSAGTYAPTNGNGTGNPPTATKVTVSGDALSGEIDSTLIWNISNDSGSLTIYPNGTTATWLYCTSTNNGVRVGTNTAKLFTIDASSGYLKHTETGRFLGIYSSQDLRCYTSATANNIKDQAIAFYVYTEKEETKEVEHYTTSLSFSDCEHENYSESITQEATCTTAGSMEYTCTNCGHSYTEIIPATGHEYTNYVSNGNATCTEDGTKTALCDNGCGAEDTITDEGSATGHNFVDFKCTECGKLDLENLDFSGRYYIATKRSSGNYFYMTNSLGDASTKRYQAVDSGLTVLPDSIIGGDADKVFVFVKNDDGTYKIYAEGISGDNKYLGWTSGNSGALVAESKAADFSIGINDDGTFSLTIDGRILALNSNADNNYFAFYTSGQANELSLISVKAPEFTGASLYVGQDLSIRYHAILGNNAGDYTVRFTMNGREVIASGEEVDGKYVFSFCGITPQCMGDVVKAELILNGEVIDTIEEYSVRQYVISAFELYSENEALLNFLSDMLYYGAAAQNYRNYKIDALVTAGLEELLTPTSNSIAADYDNKSIVTEDGYDKANAKFTAAGVNFDYNNRIYVKFTTENIGNVAITVGGNALEIIDLGDNKYMAYSDAISALEFGTEVIFTLTYEGNVAQTLTYTINDYIVAMTEDAEMGELVNALYCYGASAEAYENSKNN